MRYLIDKAKMTIGWVVPILQERGIYHLEFAALAQYGVDSRIMI